MKLLLDTCVWGGARAELQGSGQDVLWTGDLAQDPGDEDILAQAHREQRVLITLDKDFGELAIRRSLPHCGIVRLVNFSARQQVAVSRNTGMNCRGEPSSLLRPAACAFVPPTAKVRKAWPLGFFEQIRIQDPVFQRPRLDNKGAFRLRA